ncbi:MAG: zinc-dependent metalloprotease [Acidimicrobiia bacterium]
MSDESQPGSTPDDFGLDLSRLVGMFGAGDGPVNWQVAREVADWTAAGGDVATPAGPGGPVGAATAGFGGLGAAAALPEEAPVDEADASQLADLAAAAQTAVVAETGLSAVFGTGTLAVGRRRWARRHLDSLRPVLEALATTLVRDGFGLGTGDEDGSDLEIEIDPELADQLGQLGIPSGGLDAAQLSQLMEMLAPALLGVQAGSMVGHLATHAFGQYDLPLPVTGEPTLLFVVENIDAFESDWSLERDDLRYWVALHEVVHAAVRSVTWVRSHLIELATEFVSGYRMDPEALESSLDVAGLDPTDPSTIPAALGDPQKLLDAMRTPEQDATLSRLSDLTAVLEGYADLQLERIGAPLIPSFARIAEAMKRHRVERGEAERFIERLLGVGVQRADYERGEAFCRGVVERAGHDGLHRLWERPGHTPTRNELEAPGLWLARIDLPDDGDRPEPA